MFLSALGLHLEASSLSTQQLCTAMLDCSRLSFTGASALLTEAASARGLQQMDADVLALMYSALLLLGHSAERSLGDEAPRAFLEALARQLGAEGSTAALTPATCVNLAYASLLAPPLGVAEHPLAAGALVERCAAEWTVLSNEEQLLLSSVHRALNLLPWNSAALRAAEQIEELKLVASLDACLVANCGQLAPVHCRLPGQPLPISSLSAEESPGSPWEPRDCLPCQGIFVTHEIREALDELSAALAAYGTEHSVAGAVSLGTDDAANPHVLVPGAALDRASGGLGSRGVAVLWGSSVHYVSAASSGADARPSPAAKFQLAHVQATQGMRAVLVPHWWWPWNLPVRERGEMLLHMLVESEDYSGACEHMTSADSQHCPNSVL